MKNGNRMEEYDSALYEDPLESFLQNENDQFNELDTKDIK